MRATPHAWSIIMLTMPLAACLTTGIAAADPGPTTVQAAGTSAPAQVDGLNAAAPGGDPVAAARSHLAANEARYRVRAADLAPLAVTADRPVSARSAGETLRTVRFAQRHRGVPVLGGQYLVHLRENGAQRTVTGVGGRYFTELKAATEAKLSAAKAAERARQLVQARLAHGMVGKRPAQVTVEQHGLVVVPRGAGVLTRHVTVRGYDPVRREPVRREMYLDARAGYPVLDYDALAKADGTGVNLRGKTVPLRVGKGGDGYRLVATGNGPKITTWNATGREVDEVSGKWPTGLAPVTARTSRFDGPHTANGAVDAHWAAGKVLDFYRDRLGRNGLDGNGSPVDSLVGVVEQGRPYANAFWDGRKMVYGAGDGGELLPLSADLDVVGHEMTHGVVEHTAGLVYLGQSGAMNEAVADYLGNAIDVTESRTSMKDPNAGLLGEDLCRTQAPKACAIRDLNDGTTVRNYLAVNTATDGQGVHLNSTIFSGALWDVREKLPPALADKVVHLALSQYMTPLDTFVDGRRAVESAARALKLTKAQRAAVAAAFDRRGIVPGWERKTLRKDSTTLVRDVTAETIPAAANGRWVAADSSEDGNEPYSMYTGRTDRATTSPQRLSPNDGRYHLLPATDGRTAVWVAVGTDDVRVLSRPLAGGPVKVLHTTGNLVTSVSVSGSRVAWNEYRLGEGEAAFLLDKGKAAPVETGEASAALPFLSGDRLVYLRSRPDAQGVWSTRTVVRDLRTGKGRDYATPGHHVFFGSPRLSDRHVFWLADALPDLAGSALFRGDLRTGKVTELVEETAAGAPATPISVRGGLVAYASQPAQMGVGALPAVRLLRAGGGTPVRVSCGLGWQGAPALDTGSRVVFLDTSAARTDLVTRAKPAGRCA